MDSRHSPEHNRIRRRRVCQECNKRFTTHEIVELSLPNIIKNDGRREEYQRLKVAEGLKKACQKRPIATQEIDDIILDLEKFLLNQAEKEITTEVIGNYLMGRLKSLDPVAYVRFASVYRTFADINEFVTDIQATSQSESGPQVTV